MWTKTFKSSAAAEDDVQEDDVEMTVEGGASSGGDPADNTTLPTCDDKGVFTDELSMMTHTGNWKRK